MIIIINYKKMKSNLILFLFLIFQILTLIYSSPEYSITFEYLLSDEKDQFKVELFNKPKNSLFDYGEDIFYSGKLETIEKFPTSRLINFNKTEFEKEIRRKQQQPFIDIIKNEFSNGFENDIKEEKEIKQEKKEKKRGKKGRKKRRKK